MTISQQLNIKEFPVTIKDKNCNNIYWENSDGCWYKKEYDEREKLIYWETNLGVVSDKRPKPVPEYTMGELVDKMGHNFKIKK
jgi:hypothetical protein